MTVYYDIDFLVRYQGLFVSRMRKKVAKSKPQTKEFNQSEIRTEIGATSSAV